MNAIEIQSQELVVMDICFLVLLQIYEDDNHWPGKLFEFYQLPQKPSFLKIFYQKPLIKFYFALKQYSSTDYISIECRLRGHMREKTQISHTETQVTQA